LGQPFFSTINANIPSIDLTYFNVEKTGLIGSRVCVVGKK